MFSVLNFKANWAFHNYFSYVIFQYFIWESETLNQKKSKLFYSYCNSKKLRLDSAIRNQFIILGR